MPLASRFMRSSKVVDLIAQSTSFQQQLLRRCSLNDDEDVYAILKCIDDQLMLALSDRVVIAKSLRNSGKLFGTPLTYIAGRNWGVKVNSFPYREITGVQINHDGKPLLLSLSKSPGVITIAIQTASFSGVNVGNYWTQESPRNPMRLPNTVCVPSNHQYREAVVDIIRQGVRDGYLGNRPPVSRPPSASATGSNEAGLAAELQRIAELRKSGVLTEDEFAQAKAKLLG